MYPYYVWLTLYQFTKSQCYVSNLSKYKIIVLQIFNPLYITICKTLYIFMYICIYLLNIYYICMYIFKRAKYHWLTHSTLFLRNDKTYKLEILNAGCFCALNSMCNEKGFCKILPRSWSWPLNVMQLLVVFHKPLNGLRTTLRKDFEKLFRVSDSGILFILFLILQNYLQNHLTYWNYSLHSFILVQECLFKMVKK